MRERSFNTLQQLFDNYNIVYVLIIACNSSILYPPPPQHDPFTPIITKPLYTGRDQSNLQSGRTKCSHCL